MARVTKLDDVLGDAEPVAPARPATPTPAPPVQASPVDQRPRKFTMLVDSADDERARRLTDAVVALAGIRATKGMRADVVRALIAIAAEDERLQRKVASALRSASGMTARR